MIMIMMIMMMMIMIMINDDAFKEFSLPELTFEEYKHVRKLTSNNCYEIGISPTDLLINGVN